MIHGAGGGSSQRGRALLASWLLFLAGARLAYEHASMRGVSPDPRPWAE